MIQFVYTTRHQLSLYHHNKFTHAWFMCMILEYEYLTEVSVYVNLVGRVNVCCLFRQAAGMYCNTVVKYILDTGIAVDIDATLSDAACKPDIHLVDILLPYANPKKLPRIVQRVLSRRQVTRQHDLVLKALSKCGCDMSVGLEVAASYGDYNSVLRLIHLGADVHYADDAALIAAVLSNRSHITEALLVNGANVHARDNYCANSAAESSKTAILSILLEWGAVVPDHSHSRSRSVTRLVRKFSETRRRT